MRNSNASGTSSGVPDERPFWSLCDSMGSLNLQNSDDEKASERRSQADERAKYSVGNSSAFSHNKVAGCFSADAAVNALSEGINKVSIGCEITSQDTRNGSMEKPEYSFVFGSNMKKKTGTPRISVMYEKSFPPDILNDIQKLNISNSKDDGNSTRSNFVDGLFRNYGFIFGEDNKVSDSYEGSATLHEDIQKLNIRNEIENSEKNAERLHEDIQKLNIRNEIENSDKNAERHMETSTNALYSEFSYKASRHENDPIINGISSVHCSFRPGEVSEPSFTGPSFGHGSRFVDTGFNFTSMREEVGTEYMEFRSSKSNNELLKESFFSGPHQHMPISGRKGEAKGSRTKKRNIKLRHSHPFHQTFAQTFVSVEEVLESKVPDSPDGCTPMDYSPYQEKLVTDQSSKTASVSFNNSDNYASSSSSCNLRESNLVDESDVLVSAAQCLYITKDDTHGELGHNDSSDHEFGPRFSADDKKWTPDISSSTAMETESKFIDDSVLVTQDTEDGTSFNFDSSSECSGVPVFNFGAASFDQSLLSASKCQHSVEDRAKVGKEISDLGSNANASSTSSFANMISVSSRNVESDPAMGIKIMQCGPQNVENTKAGSDAKLEANKDPITDDSRRVAEQEACEKWRLRGNQAYADGLFFKAEEYYTRGVNSISQKNNSQSCNRALMLCYSNRAAARLSLGKMREALSDCMLAVAIDPQFIRAHLRAANCHLLLGEVDDALRYFNKCLLSQHDGNLDQRILAEASNGLQKAQKVADYMVQAKDLLEKRTSNEVTQALQLISDSLSICTYSETLMEMKAETLLKLRRYEGAIKFCEQGEEHGEENAGTNVHPSNTDKSGNTVDASMRSWRWNIISRANFYLGRFEEALELLRRNNDCSGSSSLFNTICELLRLKAAGNEAFKEGRHQDAIKHYSAALSFNTDSRPFSAVCFCNRAAAYQAMGQITDAIADCSLATALDAGYAKALSRRAALYERIKDYGQASNDLHRLISLLEKQIKDNVNEDGILEKSIDSDLCQASLRLSIVEEAARKESPLDVYLILGIEPSSSAADVKRAYRKAALKHHPDKAGQLLARSEHLEDVLWREVAEEVRRDADRLFKMIGEAYTILSDPSRYKFMKH